MTRPMIGMMPADPLDEIGKGASTLCDLTPGCKAGKEAVKAAVTTVTDVKDTVTQIKDFTSDPLGYIATSIQKACEDFSRELFGSLAKALHPDFSLDWFLRAYRVSFAFAIILMGFLVLHEFVSYRKGERGADEMFTTIIGSIPKFFLGVIMGPWLGNLLSGLVGAMCDDLVKWGGGGSGGIESVGGGLTNLITGPGGSLVGGSIVAIIIFICMLASFICLAVTMLFMLITLYMAGAAFPLGWAWVVSSRNKATALKVVNLIVGVLFSAPLVFFMLGVVMSMVKANLTGGGGDTGKGMTHLFAIIGSILALLMSAFSPWAFAKFAPIGIRATEGSSLGSIGGKSSRGGSGKSSSSDGQLSQISRKNSSGSSTGGAPSGTPAGGGSGALSAAGGAGGGAGAAAGSGTGAGAGAGAGGGAGAAGAAPLAVAAAVHQGAKKAAGTTNDATDGAVSAGTDATASSSKLGGRTDVSSQPRTGSGQTAQASQPRGSSSSANGSGGSTGTAGSAGGQMGRTASQGNGSQSPSGAGGGGSSRRGSGSKGSSPAGMAASALQSVQQASERIAQETTKHSHHQEGGH